MLFLCLKNEFSAPKTPIFEPKTRVFPEERRGEESIVEDSPKTILYLSIGGASIGRLSVEGEGAATGQYRPPPKRKDFYDKTRCNQTV